MPNLRKRTSVLTYNDDAIYRAIENQRRISNNREAKISKIPNEVIHNEKESRYVEGPDRIPEFVYASDGRKFFPCLFCCHAFAVKEHQIGHMLQCSFRVPETSESSVAETMTMKQPPQQKPLRTYAKKSSNQTNKTVNTTTQHLKLNPKIIVQKSKHFELNTVMSDGAIKIIKRQPNKGVFPKIKLDPGSQKNKFIKNLNLQPRLGGQVNKLIKHAQNVKQQPDNITCQICNIIFESMSSLAQHRREEHVYPKIYVSADQLKEYDEMYKNSDMSKCTICSKPVPKVRWSRHLQTHINERKYNCNVCKRTFGRKDHLNVHERKHITDMTQPLVKE